MTPQKRTSHDHKQRMLRHLDAFLEKICELDNRYTGDEGVQSLYDSVCKAKRELRMSGGETEDLSL